MMTECYFFGQTLPVTQAFLMQPENDNCKFQVNERSGMGESLCLMGAELTQ